MNSVINFIIFFIFISFFILLIFRNFSLSYKISKIKKELLKSELEKEIIKNKLTIENSESFVAFLEKSRQDAFSYIENVQLEINRFISTVGPVINHFDEYGDSIWTPLTEDMKRVSAAYKDLKTLIPEDYGKIDI